MAARINSASIRRVNLVRVFHALRRHPNSSQTELQRLTGLDKATTSMVVTQKAGSIVWAFLPLKSMMRRCVGSSKLLIRPNPQLLCMT